MTHPIDLNRTSNKFIDLLRLMRPLQWTKNAFVFVGFVFGSSFIDWHLLLQVIIVFCSFCMCSSCIYILNDIIDCEKDRNHPSKKSRPIASGKVSINGASILLVVLGFTGLALGFWVSYKVCLILLIYMIMNTLYSYKFKEIVIFDVFCISMGFMLRILSGTIGVGIPPTKWLLLCAMMLTLFLGFCKRRAELSFNHNEGKGQRKVLDHYDTFLLDQLITICATAVILTYSIYTMSPETVELHHTQRLLYTVPFVVFAIFRYLYLLSRYNIGEDPSLDLVKDPQIVLCVLCWVCSVVYIFNVG